MNEHIARDTFQVGRYSCTISLAKGAINTVWEPHQPRDLNKQEVAEYRKGRDAFLATVAPGKRVLVLEA